MQVEMQEDSRNDGWVGEKGEDPHVAATSGAEQRQHLIDADGAHSSQGAHRRSERFGAAPEAATPPHLGRAESAPQAIELNGHPVYG